MSTIVVCRLDQIAESAVHHGSREMISLLAQNQHFHRPGVIDPDRHLTLGVNDIASPQEGLVVPGEDHVESIIAFARAWDQQAPLIVHCWLGISRSPAAALIAALSVAPDQDDMMLAERLRKASPFVTPNARLIEIADGRLGRGGALIRSVYAIGRGADAFEGDRFSLAVRPETKASPEQPIQHGNR